MTTPSPADTLNLVLRSKRLTLRPMEESDFNDVHAYSSDPEVVKFMQWGPNTEEQTRNFMNVCLAHKTEEPRQTYDFAVVKNDGGEFLGSITLRVVKEKMGEIGYVYNPRAWGKGYASEAAEAVIRFGFDRLNLQKVSATCDPQNHGSARVLQKGGMKLEGYLRKHIHMKGIWRDTLLFGCARGELEKNLAEADALLKETAWSADRTQAAPKNNDNLNGNSEAAMAELFAMGELSRIKLKKGTTLNTTTGVLDRIVILVNGALKAEETAVEYKSGSIIHQPGATRKANYLAVEDSEVVSIRLGP